ncbi:outer membrane beta-barrel protein [candidate division GN15 bacterium]|nr:outer membrane beta-barrel protein [candidate division GN15 bacterium]
MVYTRGGYVKKLLLTFCLVVLLAGIAQAQVPGPKFGVGASGGLNIPILQDDQESGSIFEFRGRLQPLPFLAVEPKISFSSYGSPDTFEDVVWDVDGSKLVMYGVDGVLGGGAGIGIRPMFVVGLGFYNIKNDDTEAFLESQTKFGWSFGAGLGIGVAPKIELDVRAKAHIVMYEGSSSKKSLAITGGLNYYFGGM